MHNKGIFASLLLRGLLLAASCAGSDAPLSILEKSSASPPSISAPGTVYVNFEHGRFVPGTVSVPAGTTVVWQVSEDYDHHWIVCDSVPFRGWFYEWYPYKYAFTEPGNYEYYDGADSKIRGIVRVY